ncbi:DNA -binding domain-containing protein [Billgrantia endophytica]|uniref:T6SS Transcription factor RovC-like DNA binding domain-containing protein n=1 Tax=Billgrantia endophytica TaxID=2033802 RepID=A0A2N7U2H1_9GAMM|nr:DUF2285 domain-containing protein [Halomonas endophytica]PMR74627.1 hypothetical protein C1H69_12245 [Halomonas endophytica]
MRDKGKKNDGLDLAWLLLRANNEFRMDVNEACEKIEKAHNSHITLGGVRFTKYKKEDEVLRGKWGVLNTPSSQDLTGHNVFWDPSLSTKSIEAKTCNCSGLSLSDISCLPHVNITGAIFERSGKCMIKIIYGFKFYQLVLARLEEIDHSKTIQLCLPMAEGVLTKINVAQSLWQILKDKNNKIINENPSAKESLLIARSIEEGASHKEIATRLFGAESVNKNWTPDGWMRARTRYSIKKTKGLIQGGYRKLI